MTAVDLNVIYDQAIAEAKKQAEWYYTKKSWISKRSRFIRSWSIILVGLGTLFPLLGGILKEFIKVDISNWGYVAIAIAGTLILYDRFFGYSTAWIRYITTELEIKKQIKEFELKWKAESCGVDLNGDCSPKVVELLNSVRSFVTLVDELVKSETLNWAVEFQTNFSELEKTLNSKVETMKPGSAKVTVTNADKYTGLSASIDNQSSRALSTTTTLFPGLSVGHHLITVTGQKDGKTEEVADVVNVEAGKLSAIELKMP